MPEQINQSCKCTYPCSRHGNCEACQEYHRKDGSRTNCGREKKLGMGKKLGIRNEE